MVLRSCLGYYFRYWYPSGTYQLVPNIEIYHSLLVPTQCYGYILCGIAGYSVPQSVENSCSGSPVLIFLMIYPLVNRLKEFTYGKNSRFLILGRIYMNNSTPEDYSSISNPANIMMFSKKEFVGQPPFVLTMFPSQKVKKSLTNRRAQNL